MYGLTKTKRVTDPLDDKVKARIISWKRAEPGYVSSGSEHSAQVDDDVTSPIMSELFYGFSVDDDDRDASPERNDFGSERDQSPTCDSSFPFIDPSPVDRTDEFRNVLEHHVLKAVEVSSACARKLDRQVVRRSVMSFLRNCGYNAAVCKTNWGSCGGVTAGNYEFIDVLSKDSSSTRYVVDLDFAAEFEIARPTEPYERMTRCLPAIFVGKIEDLKRILKAMSDAAKRSLKSRGLHLPPWRKHRFMQNKWLGAHRRTSNIFPAYFDSANKSYRAVECRVVGFEATVNCGRLLLPAAART